MTAALVYERRGTGGKFAELARRTLGSQTRIVSVSDFKGMADLWLGNAIYRSSDQDMVAPPFEDEVIARCRFLRGLDPTLARRLVRRVHGLLDDCVKGGDFKAVFGPMPDCYSLDILARVAKAHGLAYNSFLGSFMRGYCRISVYGELNKTRARVSEDEAKAVFDVVVRDDYRPDFPRMRVKSRASTIATYSRRKLIESAYYPLRKLVEKDPLNYHYNSLVLEGHPSTYLGQESQAYYKSIEQLQLDGPTVYMPLHMTPEATTDYWIEDWQQLPYEAAVIAMLRRSSPSIRFVLKDHPSMYGWRSTSFYRTLMEFENVDLVHPYESSNTLLDRVENVLVHSGSVGVEALLRRKKVFALTPSYYSWMNPNVVMVDALRGPEELEVEWIDFDPISFLMELLAGHVPGALPASFEDADDRLLDVMAEAADFHMRVGNR